MPIVLKKHHAKYKVNTTLNKKVMSPFLTDDMSPELSPRTSQGNTAPLQEWGTYIRERCEIQDDMKCMALKNYQFTQSKSPLFKGRFLR